MGFIYGTEKIVEAAAEPTIAFIAEQAAKQGHNEYESQIFFNDTVQAITYVGEIGGLKALRKGLFSNIAINQNYP